MSVAFSPDRKRLASGSYDQTVKLWDAANGQEALTVKGHSQMDKNYRAGRPESHAYEK